MTRTKSVAAGVAVLTAVIAATVALALNTGFVADSSASPTFTEEDAPVTTTTTYEQYLEEYYANNPTTTAPATTTTVPPEPVVVYEYVDVPVTVPPPQVIYVPVTTPAAPATDPVTDPTTTGPTTTAAPETTTPPTTAAPTTQPPTTRPPTTTAPPMELLEVAMYDFATVTVASHGPGQSLQLWQIEKNAPWTWKAEKDNGPVVEVKFFNTDTGKEAKFQLRIDGDGYRLKTEGDGLPEQDKSL